IITGTRREEIKLFDTAAAAFNYKFDYCLIKNNEDSLDFDDKSRFDNIVLNEPANFVNDSAITGPYDFNLEEGSLAIDAGNLDYVSKSPYLQTDFEGKSRIADGKPDLGAFERTK
ncbi:MAG: hypothetical protein MI922_03205, partial [Bacteroidales bacterium]|nr:hypothetical protein [Bacteroidales bacterium]